MKTYPTFQEALDTVESLTIDEQTMLIEIIQNRLREQQRQELLKNVAQAEKEYSQSNFCRGSVNDLMKETSKVNCHVQLIIVNVLFLDLLKILI